MKYYAIDTNIILDDVMNVLRLADEGENVIVITETVLEEIDKFKSGNEEINYQAREFQRMLNESEVVKNLEFGAKNYGIELKFGPIKILIIKNLIEDEKKNDIKIIKTIARFNEITNLFRELIFVSNDILFRTFVYLLTDYKVQPLFKEEPKNVNFYQGFTTEQVLPNKEVLTNVEITKLVGNIPQELSTINITDGNGKPFFFIREDKHTWRKLDERSKINLFGIKPLNLQQHIYIEHLLNMKNEIVVVDAPAGSAKTLLALVSAMKLKQQGKIDKIVYIRKTIISGDKLDELGFLPGNLDEKLEGYIHPLRDNLELIVQLKNKKKKHWTKDEMEEAIKKLEEEFNIEYVYGGHLRGRNLKGFIIFDEAQNSTIADLKTLLSRLVDGSRIAILGSTRQIDNPYLNRYNNALTFMKNQCGTLDPIQIQGIALDRVYRGKIPEWVEITIP